MRFYYDFHIHTCLSPCASDDSTPSNVVGIAKLNGLDVIAIADHNSVKNVEACMKLGEEYGILVIAGMELTTSEDIHVLCLFPNLQKGREFEDYIFESKMKIANKSEIFGRQLIVDENDNIIGEEENLLISATSVGIYDIVNLMKEYGGAAIAAHIDRPSNGILETLGEIDEWLGFRTVEFSKNATTEFKRQFSSFNQIVDSDSHSPETISEKDSFLDLKKLSVEEILCFVNSDKP